ncbi:hypothetical protein NX810_09400 [Bacillus subtilis]|uniref:hypothetical protein n=1 Tax=Bacillus subtilis TaxID=1423 RepID=UPI001009EA73|nr:hypothetical protein [Bacillus subtilis]RXM08252.1 hypothetical protein ETL41_00250 [Bacillus subtilis]UVV91231.1 hypothetical protein NX810_09400 [Bacillus subtilis]
MDFNEIVKYKLETLKPRRLTKFIRTEFPSKGMPHSEQDMKKYESLKQLKDDELSFGIASMARIESGFVYSKFAGVIILILSLLLGTYKILFSDYKQPLESEFYFIYTMFCILILLSAVLLDIRIMTTATYFKTLLEQAKVDKVNQSANRSKLANNLIEVQIREWWPIWKKNIYNRQAKNLEEVLLKWSDDELITYITEYFGYWTKRNKIAELQRIRGLDLDIIILGIGRMIEIEESSDNSKIIPGLTTVSTFFATQLIYYLAYENKGNPTLTSVSVGLIFSALIFWGMTWGMNKGRTHRSGAAKYRSYLEQVKSEMEKK